MSKEHHQERFPVLFKFSIGNKHGQRSCRVEMASTDTFRKLVQYEKGNTVNEWVSISESPNHGHDSNSYELIAEDCDSLLEVCSLDSSFFHIQYLLLILITQSTSC